MDQTKPINATEFSRQEPRVKRNPSLTETAITRHL